LDGLIQSLAFERSCSAPDAWPARASPSPLRLRRSLAPR